MHIFILLLLASAAMHAQEVPITARIVSQEEAQRDLADGWVLRIAGMTPENFDRELRIPYRSTPMPIPNEHNEFQYAEWSNFLKSSINPSRNAIRLLGPPDIAVVDAVHAEFTWNRRILNYTEGGDFRRHIKMSISLNGQEVEWSYPEYKERFHE